MSKSGDEYKELGSLDEVREFLTRRGTSHSNGYYHYTNLSAWRGMLRSRNIHLSLGRMMNDLAEPTKGDTEKWKRTYVASFAFGKLENVAMWGIYGNPFAEAVRIRFGRKDVLSDVRKVETHQAKIFSVTKAENQKFAYTDLLDEICDAAEISLHDIGYWTGRSLYWDGNKKSGRRCPDIGEAPRRRNMTGFVKNVAWQYERETRLVITLPNLVVNPPEMIAIPFESAIKNAKVLRGPCTVLDEDGEDCYYEQSHLYGKVRFRHHCEVCLAKTKRCPFLY